jgi:hypothetical protein
LASSSFASAVPWTTDAKNERITVEKSPEKQVLSVTGATGRSSTHLITMEQAALKRSLLHDGRFSGTFFLKGRVRYADVQGVGFLEMWTYYADGGMYFSRTLGDSGPMGKLTGSSDWREVVLPFKGPPDTVPIKITVALVLEGKGTVWLEPFTLSAAPITPAPASASSASEATVTGGGIWLLPAILAPMLLVSVLAFVPATRELARPIALIAAGVATLLVAATLLMALTQGTLDGGAALSVAAGSVAIAVFGGIAFLTRRTTEDELRRMRAMDSLHG